VGNALKYCRTGSIEVILHSSVAEAVLSVRDTGVGIPADDLSRIFERFHRVDDTARTTSGTGIGELFASLSASFSPQLTSRTCAGLALTLEIVKVLGGQLELESEPGRGSTFLCASPAPSLRT
jgi:signal transduction histidine kinase